MPPWFYLDVDPRGRLIVVREEPIGLVEADIWRPAWDAYTRANTSADAAPYAESEEDVEAVCAAQDELRDASAAIYALLSGIVGAELDTGPAVGRSPALAAMPLAPLVALARPDLLHRLPWDVSGVALDAMPRAVAELARWCLPTPRDLTILVPQQLGLGRMFAAFVGEPRTPHARHDFTAKIREVARWLGNLELALDAARLAGAEVIRPAHRRDFLEVLDGRHRRCLQLVAHIDEHHDLHLDDGTLSLSTLRERVAVNVDAGWRSPLAAADLSACGSEAQLAGILRSAGVAQVSARFTRIYLGPAAAWLRAIYERGLFDGATPISHAWLRAALEEC